MKKGLFIIIAVVLAPVLLVGVVALAAGDWRQVGATAGGDQVLVSSVTAQKNGLRTCMGPRRIQRTHQTAAGWSVCGTASAGSLQLYERQRCAQRCCELRMVLLPRPRRKLVVSKKTHRDDQFGQAAEGDFGEIARDFVCKQK